jgi:antitoxin CcdA
MKHELTRARKPVNVSLDTAIVTEAKALGINVSQACEKGLAAETKRERERQWLIENMEAIEATNRWVEEHGLPLEKYRVF